MLSKHLKHFHKMYSNLHTFNSLEIMRNHLTLHKYAFLMVYFRAEWNPQCIEADKQVNKFVSNNAGIQVIKIDSDQAPKIAKNYGIKAEPQFVFCLYGTELIRQIGPNYELLQDKLQKMSDFANQQQYKGVDTKWLPYESTFKEYQQRVLNDLYHRYINGI